MEITVLGIDLAKNIFQLHGVNQQGKAVLKKRLTRNQLLPFVAQLRSCLIGLEACSGAHYWAREFKKLGHDVRLMAPQFVKPFVKSNKNDAADAEAICEAVMRPNMRFVGVKSIEQQDIQCLHRIRSQAVASRTAVGNEIRGVLAEYGVIIPQGLNRVRHDLEEKIQRAIENGLMSLQGQELLGFLRQQLKELDERIKKYDQRIQQIHHLCEKSQRLAQIPGVGPLTATALVAAVGNPQMFKNGRALAAWLGLVPAQSSSGGKQKLLGISKRGDPYLRCLFIHGARAFVRVLDRQPESYFKSWLQQLIQRRGTNRAIVALANKNARRSWVLLARQEEFRLI